MAPFCSFRLGQTSEAVRILMRAHQNARETSEVAHDGSARLRTGDRDLRAGAVSVGIVAFA